MPDVTKDKFDDLFDRCEADPGLNFAEELRGMTTNPEAIALLDDMERRRDALHKRVKDAFAQHVAFTATPQTSEAILSYHIGVIIPLMAELVNAITDIQFELAFHRLRLHPEPIKFD